MSNCIEQMWCSKWSITFPEYFLGANVNFNRNFRNEKIHVSSHSTFKDFKEFSRRLFWVWELTWWSQQNLIFQKTFWESNCIEQMWCFKCSITFPEYFLGANVDFSTENRNVLGTFKDFKESPEDWVCIIFLGVQLY